MQAYKILNKNRFFSGKYSIVPIRSDDRYLIMEWRNQQIYHLRQSKTLTKADQDAYFTNIVAKLFEKDHPEQILFSYLEDNTCIGYGGLVHINWLDQNAEISFLLNPSIEEAFDFHWSSFLTLIQQVAFAELKFHKIFTYAFDVRPHLYPVLEKNNFFKDAVLKEHCLFNGRFIDVLIHSKLNKSLWFRNANLFDTELIYQWANHPTVRKQSFSDKNIEYGEHKVWYENKLKSSTCEFYIFFSNNCPIGSIRFELDENSKAFINYMIDPSYHGQGYGKLILQLGIEELIIRRPEVQEIYGYVLHKNTASIKIFENLGFNKSISDDTSYKFKKMIENADRTVQN